MHSALTPQAHDVVAGDDGVQVPWLPSMLELTVLVGAAEAADGRVQLSDASDQLVAGVDVDAGILVAEALLRGGSAGAADAAAAAPALIWRSCQRRSGFGGSLLQRVSSTSVRAR